MCTPAGSLHRKTQTIVIGSGNPVKLEAAKRAFSRVFPEVEFHTVTCRVASGVASQPQGDDEALSGALHRARAASTQVPAADFFVGIEGAIEDTADGMKSFAWVVVISGQRLGKGRTATFYLPEAVAQRVRNGAELGGAIAAHFGTVSAKRKDGAIGRWTSASQTVFKSELHQSCCEVVTKPCATVSELHCELRSNRQRLAEVAECGDVAIGLSGTHPFSLWHDLPITREPRRLDSEYLFQEAHRQCLAFALHIHVGVPNRDAKCRADHRRRSTLVGRTAPSCLFHD